MGEEPGENKNKGKLCGCMPYPIFAWIVLVIETILLVVAVATEYWLPGACYIAKIVLISITLCCC